MRFMLDTWIYHMFWGSFKLVWDFCCGRAFDTDIILCWIARFLHNTLISCFISCYTLLFYKAEYYSYKFAMKSFGNMSNIFQDAMPNVHTPYFSTCFVNMKRHVFTIFDTSCRQSPSSTCSLFGSSKMDHFPTFKI